MPKDKHWSIRPLLQVLAGVGMLTALLLDPGCRSDNKVELTQATPIKERRSVTAPDVSNPTSGSLTMGAMTVADTSANAPSPQASNTTASPTNVAPSTGEPDFAALLASDPLAALKQLHQEQAASGKSYTCLFTRQERLPSGVGPEQDVRVKFRPAPYSVAMEFVRNTKLVKRALFVENRWRDESADDAALRDLVFVQPAGLAGVLIKSLKQPIRGAMAKRSGRRAIDRFGFERTLGLIVEYCDKAKKANKLKLDYEGEAVFGGRRVWVLRRVLPYTGENGDYPDLSAVMYIDQAYRVPIAIHTFSDARCRPEDLLGKYEYREIDFNANVTDTDFDPATYGL